MIKKRKQCNFNVGDYVFWGPDKEFGRIKAFKNNEYFCFVVFNCNNDWENYKNYTGATVNVKGLIPAYPPEVII